MNKVQELDSFMQQYTQDDIKSDIILEKIHSLYRMLTNEERKDLYNLINLCMQILKPEPLFFIINSYTAGLSPIVLDNLLKIFFKDKKGTITSGELGIKAKNDLILPCGVYGRYEK